MTHSTKETAPESGKTIAFRAICATDDNRITAALRKTARATVFDVEFVEENGDINGGRVRRVPCRGWYCLTHSVSVNRGGEGESADWDLCGNVGAIFHNGRLVGIEGDSRMPLIDFDGSRSFTLAEVVR